MANCISLGIQYTPCPCLWILFINKKMESHNPFTFPEKGILPNRSDVRCVPISIPKDYID